MSSALDLIYQYRQLVGKCEADGLDFDEIQLLQTIESVFADRGLVSEGGCPHGTAHRKFLRQPASLSAELKHRGHSDCVQVTNIGPGGLECVGPAFLQDDDIVEVIFDDDELNLQYRFKAIVTWFLDDDDLCTIGMRFLGTPLVLRYAGTSIRTLDLSVADAA